jgi:hypothetical protein
VSLVLAVSFSAGTQSTTYEGVVFPHGDRAFADRVVEYVAASCVRDAFDDPEEALGPPDVGGIGCNGCNSCHTNAVSLGYRLSSIDDRGYLVVEFVDNVLMDVVGSDLFVFITNGRPCRVEISADGMRYIFVGEVVGYPAAIDIAPFVAEGERFRFVRLSDVPADEDHSSCPGPSIDAIGAMGTAETVIVGETFGSLELQPIGDLLISLDDTARSILIILDSSSSMAEPIDGQTKIEVAKDVITDLLDNLPEEMNVGVRVFSGCGRSRLVSPIQPLDRAWLTAQVMTIQPGGATPIAYTLEQAKGDFEGIPDTKMILLVSDGMETCHGDPVKAAEDLIRAGYDLRIHVVGFDIAGDNEAREQLKQIAQATGGVYYDARNSEELRRALSLAAPFSYTVYDENGNVVYTGRLGDGGEAGPQLAAGVYSVVIDADPPITLTGVLVQDQRTTTITVERANGGYHAEVDQ